MANAEKGFEIKHKFKNKVKETQNLQNEITEIESLLSKTQRKRKHLAHLALQIPDLEASRKYPRNVIC